MEETAAAAASPAPNAATPALSDPAAGAAADGEASADHTAVADDEHDSKEVVLRRYFLQEWELVSAILHRIVAAGGVADPGDVHRIRSIVSTPLLYLCSRVQMLPVAVSLNLRSLREKRAALRATLAFVWLIIGQGRQ